MKALLLCVIGFLASVSALNIKKDKHETLPDGWTKWTSTEWRAYDEQRRQELQANSGANTI